MGKFRCKHCNKQNDNKNKKVYENSELIGWKQLKIQKNIKL